MIRVSLPSSWREEAGCGDGLEDSLEDTSKDSSKDTAASHPGEGAASTLGHQETVQIDEVGWRCEHPVFTS